MFKNYISWSALYLFEKDKNEFFAQEIMSIKQPPTDAMILGSIVHDAISGKSELEKELKKNHFTSDKLRVCSELVKNAKRYPEQEVNLLIQGSRENGLKCNVMAVFDGYDKPAMLIGERKTTANGWRTEEDVNQHGQLTLYAMVHYFLLQRIPALELERLDINNGKIKMFQTSRTEDQIMEMRDRINAMYDYLVLHGWWERRIVKSDKNVKEAIANTHRIQTMLV